MNHKRVIARSAKAKALKAKVDKSDDHKKNSGALAVIHEEESEENEESEESEESEDSIGDQVQEIDDAYEQRI